MFIDFGLSDLEGGAGDGEEESLLNGLLRSLVLPAPVSDAAITAVVCRG